MTDTPQQSNQTSMMPFDDEGFDATVRRVQHDGRLFVSVIDVVGTLTGSAMPRRYWTDMKRRIQDEGFVELYAFCVQLKLKAPDGKMRDRVCRCRDHSAYHPVHSLAQSGTLQTVARPGRHRALARRARPFARHSPHAPALRAAGLQQRVDRRTDGDARKPGGSDGRVVYARRG